MAKVLFIQDMLFEFIGPMQISALLKKEGHECDLLILDEEKNIIKKIKKIKPDIIAFSVMTGSHKTLLNFSRRIKKEMNVLTVFGGPHATFYDDLIEEDCVDIVCFGEGEYPLLDLCNNLNKDITKIKNLWVKKSGKIIRNEVRHLIDNLDELPFPDRELYYERYNYLKILPTKKFMTGRGCPYNCSFCFNHELKKIYSGKGKYVRKRSINNVIGEILNVKKQGDMKVVRFSDDTFTLYKDWLLEFLEEYKKRVDLPFTCLARANEIDDNVVKKLKESGCINIFIGLESGSDRIRNSVLRKNLSKGDIINAAKIFHQYKLKFGTYNMFGNPTESINDALETVMLNAKIKTDFPFSTVLQPYPGTDISRFAIEMKLLPEDFCPDDLTLMNTRSQIILKNKREIINLHRFFFYGVRFPFLLPLIKILIKLPENKPYYFIFQAGVAWTKSGSFGLGFFDTVKLAWKLKSKI